MLIILAAICFLLLLIGAHLGMNLLYLGLLFFALHFLFDWRPWVRTMPPRQE
jgi:hypothetical protein